MNLLKNQKSKKIILCIIIALIIFMISIGIVLNANTETTRKLKLKYLNLKAGNDETSWQLWTFMLDSSVNKGNEKLTNHSWNATTRETRVLTIQVNYQNTDVQEDYEAGQLQIIVDNLGVVYPTGSTATPYKEATSISADKSTDVIKKYEWSYRYDKENNQYIFTNNKPIEKNHNFEGTIQLAYNFSAEDLLNGSDVTISSKIVDSKNNIDVNSLNDVKFEFTSTESTATMTKQAYKLQSYDGLGSNATDYIWVKYYTRATMSTSNGVRYRVEEKSRYLKEDVLPGCIVLDEDQKQVSPDEEGIYKIPVKNSYSYYDYAYYYIGYPKSEYNLETITEHTEWWGKVQDSYYKLSGREELKELVEKDLQINLAEYEIEYGEDYSLTKQTDSYYKRQSYNKLINPKYGEDIEYNIGASATYMGEKYTFKIGDDLLYITSTDGNDVKKLSDDDYHFKTVYIYGNYWKNGNDAIITKDKYDMQLFVRHRNQKDYEKYENSFKNTTSSKTITFQENDIVGWYLEVYDLEEGLNISTSGMNTVVNIQTNDEIQLEGNIYNFNNLEIYTTDESGVKTYKNTPKWENYTSNARIFGIDTYDMENFGRYVQRAEANSTYGADIVDFCQTSSITNQSQDNEYFYRTLELSNGHSYYDATGTGTFKGLKVDIIFPLGVELNTTKEEIINSFSSSYYKQIKKQDGNYFENQAEFIEFLKRNATVEINRNYQNTGKLWIEVKLNFEKEPIDIYELTSYSYYVYQFKVPIKIPYESYFTNGATYSISSYVSPINDEEEDYLIKTKYTDTKDIDNDEKTNDFYSYGNSTSTSIVPAVSSYQEVNKSVWTPTSENQWLSDIASVPWNGEYKYKLRVRTGINDIKDLVLYDNLENTGDWHGFFTGVDLDFTTKKGYIPTVYYSTDRDAGTLQDDADAWKVYSSDDETIDKTTIASLAFDFKDQTIKSGDLIYVVVEMKAPDNVSLENISKNKCYTKWTAIDSMGGVVKDMTGISSNVSLVATPNSKDNLTVYKIWEDDGNALNVRPDSVDITLYQNGEEFEKATLKAEEGWQYVFNVPVADENGVLYEYSVSEDTLELYSSKVTKTDEKTDEGTKRSFTITNTLKEDDAYLDIASQKVWEDNNNKRLKRPESIEINLKRDGETIDTATLEQNNNWYHEFLKQPIYKSRGEKYNYTIEEVVEEIPYYTSEIEELKSNGLVINFNSECETENVTYDYVEIYYNYSGTMYKAGKWGGSSLANLQVEIPSKDFYLYWHTDTSNENYYGFSIDNIKNRTVKFDKNATTGNYSSSYAIEEVTGDQYPESDHGNYGNNVDKLWHYISTSTDEEVTEVDDYKFFQIKNTLGIIPAEITQNIEKTGTEKVTNLDEPISYNINYTASINEYEGNATITITDTLPHPIDEEKTRELGTLDEGTYHPENNTITWTLTENNIRAILGASARTVTFEKNITVYYTNVGKEETEIINNVQGKIELESTGQTEESEIATHSTKAEFPRDIPVTKEWNYKNNIYEKPTSITLEIRNKNKPDEILGTCEVNEENGWSNIFENILRYDENGDEIEYIITEADYSVKDYYSLQTENVESGLKVTNTYIGPEISYQKESSTEFGNDYVVEGETITYTITVTNAGGVEKEVVIKDKIPDGTTFKPESIKINDSSIYNEENLAEKNETHLSEGIKVNVPKKENEVNGEVKLSFEVTVNELEEGTYERNISNTAQVDNENTNTEERQVKIPHITVEKQSEPETNTEVSKKEVIKYKIVIKNDGLAPGKVTVKDAIPEGTSFVSGSIHINERSLVALTQNMSEIKTILAPANEELVEEELTDEDLQSGIDLVVDAQTEVTVEFEVRVEDIDDEHEIKNKATVYDHYEKQEKETNETLHKYAEANFTVEKLISTQYGKNYVIPGEEITYTIKVTNAGSLGKDIIIKDKIPGNTTFKSWSIRINGSEKYNDENLIYKDETDLERGIEFYVPKRENGKDGESFLSFTVTVNEGVTGDVANTATFIRNAEEPKFTEESTNEVKAPVLKYEKLAEVVLRKNPESTLDGNNVSVGDTIRYTIRVSNTGTVNINNVVVQDKVPEGTVLSSIENDGVAEENEITWEIEEIEAQSYKDVCFEVEVKYNQSDKMEIINKALVDSEETNETIHTYNKPEVYLESSVEKTTTQDIVTSKNTKIYYELNFKAKVENFSGKAVVTIVDTLPYPINESGSELDNGKYEEIEVDGNKVYRIVWQEEIENIYSFRPAEAKEIELTKKISLEYVYENINEIAESLVNTVDTTIELQEPKADNPEEYEKVTEDKASDEVEIPIEIPAEVIVHHYLYDEVADEETEIELAKDEIMEGKIGDPYSTTPSSEVPQNYRCREEHPENYEGKMTEEDIVVNYYYSLIPTEITNEMDKSTTLERETLIKEDGVVPYKVKYTVHIKDYIGKALVEIVDTLPAKIDKEKSNLAEGTYDEENNTITWTEEISGIDTFANLEGDYEGGFYQNGTYTKEIVKELELVYKEQDVVKDLENIATGNVKVYYPEIEPSVAGEIEVEEEASDNQIIKQEYIVNLNIRKVWEDDDDLKGHRPNNVKVQITSKAEDSEEKIIDSDVILNEENEWTYRKEGLPKYDENGKVLVYSVKENLEENSLEYYIPRIIKTEEIVDPVIEYNYEVINSYKLLNTDLKADITKEGTEKITSSKEPVNYKIHYTSEIEEYIGEGKVRIVDILPYAIDEENSNLGGGKYKEIKVPVEQSESQPETNSEDATGPEINNAETDSTEETKEETYYIIVWEEELPHINTEENGTYKVDITKEISVVYSNLDATKDSMENKVLGRTELYETGEYNEKEATHETKIEINGKVTAKYYDKETGEEIAEEEIKEGRAGTDYKTEQKEIEDYDLVATKGEPEGKITEEEQIVEYYYERPETEVVVKYVDKDTGEELTEDEIIKGRVRDKYTSEEKDFETYKLVEVQGEPEGEMERETKEVKYIYERKPAEVKVRHLEKGTEKELAPEETIKGKIDDEYNAERKVIYGYKAAEPEPENKTGKMTEETTVVTYYYDRMPSGTLVVKYVDRDTGEEITYTETVEEGKTEVKTYRYEIQGYVNDDYSTESKQIPYYDLVETPWNASGKLTESGDTVIYYYAKQPFNMTIEKEIESITVNGEARRVTNRKLMKIDIKSENAGESIVDVTYLIRVTNTGRIDGQAEIEELVPKGYTVNVASNEWKQEENGTLRTTVSLKAGESKTYEISLRLKTVNVNTGSTSNVAQIVGTDNIPHYRETTEQDNISNADVVIGIGTGMERRYTIIAKVVMTLELIVITAYGICKKAHTKKVYKN